MAVQSIVDAGERGHLIAEVSALLIVAVVLGVLMRRNTKAA
jgi:uncharacterized protein DUF6632